jgi:hypothetical protein
MRLRWFIRYCAALLTAEIASSFLSWHGTPTDWRGEPLHFWIFELWRLQSWALFFGACVVLWFFCWRAFHPRVRDIGLWLLAGVLAVSIEVLTTVRYWRQLSWTESAYLGISYFRSYLWEHLSGWIVALLLISSILYSLERQRERRFGPSHRNPSF